MRDDRPSMEPMAKYKTTTATVAITNCSTMGFDIIEEDDEFDEFDLLLMPKSIGFLYHRNLK
jgi:hypothetical protein